MKGDFSRDTFDRTNHYHSVLMQQGRVQVDADWNEEQEIDYRREVRTVHDEIGGCGVPSSVPDSFQIDLAPGGKDLTISQGRIYVSGVLCENESDQATILHQPDLPLKTGALGEIPGMSTAGIYQVYLDVWSRHITAVEDPAIRETALGGPDTATRVKTVWQVKLNRVADRGTAVTCASAGSKFVGVPGKLTASVVPSGKAGPCVLPPQSGYRRLENQLYRVEIHKPGKMGEATFKWSRENGSVVTAILPPPGGGSGFSLAVQTTGRDEELGFAPGQWVELLDDRLELLDGRGTLYQVAKVDPAARTIDLTPSGSAPVIDAKLHPKLRLWNQTNGAEVLTAAAAISLEDGIQVQFSGGAFETGDYWLIPARTAIDNAVGNIEWPVDGVGNPAAVDRRAVAHRYCSLAMVDFDGSQFLPVGPAVLDCRDKFDDLVTLTRRRNGGCCQISVGPEDLVGGVTLQSIVDGQKGKGPVHICLKPGIYVLPATLRLNASHPDTTLEGCPEGAVLRGSADPQAGFSDGLIAVTNANHVKIQKLRLELPLAPFPTGQLAQNTLSSIGIRALDSNGLTVRQCVFVQQHSSQRMLFSVGIFGGGSCTGWVIEGNDFSGVDSGVTSTPVNPAGVASLPQLLIGLLIHPTVLSTTSTTVVGTTVSVPTTKLLRSLTGSLSIARNSFRNLQFAGLLTADSGAISCRDNDVQKCSEGFWFLSLQSLQMISPDQEITFDAAYEQEVGLLLAVFGNIFQNVNYQRAWFFALFYPVAGGWVPPTAAALPVSSFTSALGLAAVTTMVGKKTIWQSITDSTLYTVKQVKPTTSTTPVMKTVRLADFAQARIDPAFAILATFGNLEPTLALSLDFSNNNLDMGTGGDEMGSALLVVDSDLPTKSVLTMTSNRMRNNSTKSAVATAWAIDRCTATGNVIINERATPNAEGKRAFAAPFSLLLLPVPNPNSAVPAFYAATGNVLLGTSTLAALIRPFPAPLNNWLFANMEA